MMVIEGEIMVTAMQEFVNDVERWEAVQRRDCQADGSFYYSVRTTGVYCRPSCASRPKRRENVAFHLTCADAERAGFRACRRCRPNEAGLAEQHAAAIAKACRLIENSDGTPDLDTLAQVNCRRTRVLYLVNILGISKKCDITVAGYIEPGR